MYTNDSKFSFRDIILQFLFVALFVFILIWLFPTKNYVNEAKSELLENNTDSQDQTSTLITSAIFNQNITTMKEASILYFTTPRLPEKKGDTVKLTLEDLLEEHLLVAPLDEQGNVCDVNKSYIEMTKHSDEYILKVNLKCGSEEEYILVHLGCYDYCEGAVCESKTEPTSKPVQSKPAKPSTLAYQYEYKLNGKWSDWSKWSEWTLEKVTSTTSKDVEVKQEKQEDTKETINALEKVTYTCPTGYTLKDKTCIKASEEIVTATVKKVLSCPTGYTLSGGKCKKGFIYTVDPTKKVTYSCPSGYVISGTTCYKETTTTMDATKVITYSCGDGYVINGTKCTRNATTITRQTYTSPRSGSEYKLVSVDTRSACTGCAYITYYTYDVTTTTTSSKDAAVSISYKCSGGYSLAGSKCVKKEDTTTAASRTESDLTCPSGYTLTSGKCKKTEISVLEPNANITYSCKEGYELVEGACVKGYLDKKEATKNVTYSCNDGYTLNDKTCTKTITGTTLTYYRFRTRTYIPGDIEWRDTKTDKTLLSKGYYLTGNKRVKSSK